MIQFKQKQYKKYIRRIWMQYFQSEAGYSRAKKVNALYV